MPAGVMGSARGLVLRVLILLKSKAKIEAFYLESKPWGKDF